jgi:hypothetical protein
MIGNFPQAFSHIGLINAAWAITQAQQRTADSRTESACVPFRPGGMLDATTPSNGSGSVAAR